MRLAGIADGDKDAPGEGQPRSGGNWPAGDAWAEQWRRFSRSAFRLETMPEYRVAAEQGLLERFLAGEPMPTGYNSAWHRRIAEYRSSGKTVQRVRVVVRPLTDYQRRQFAWAYPGNVAAGEDIRVWDLTGQPDPGFPIEDFWIFDETTVVRMHYQRSGEQVGRELLPDDAPEVYLRRTATALAGSVPFAEYLDSLPG